MMIGNMGGRVASILALCTMHSVFPPSVPPTSRNISGLLFDISSISSSVSSKENSLTILAPAPSVAIFAASDVSSGTSPEAIMRRPPAAEEQASVFSYSISPILSFKIERPLLRPSFISLSTVV